MGNTIHWIIWLREAQAFAHRDRHGQHYTLDHLAPGGPGLRASRSTWATLYTGSFGSGRPRPSRIEIDMDNTIQWIIWLREAQAFAHRDRHGQHYTVDHLAPGGPGLRASRSTW